MIDSNSDWAKLRFDVEMGMIQNRAGGRDGDWCLSRLVLKTESVLSP